MKEDAADEDVSCMTSVDSKSIRAWYGCRVVAVFSERFTVNPTYVVGTVIPYFQLLCTVVGGGNSRWFRLVVLVVSNQREGYFVTAKELYVYVLWSRTGTSTCST